MFIHGNKEGISDEMKVDMLVSQFIYTHRITPAHLIVEDNNIYLSQDMHFPLLMAAESQTREVSPPWSDAGQ